MDLVDIWPLFGLRLLTPRLELRPLRDTDLPGLVEAALAGIHEPDRMPFAVPWTEAEPQQLAQSMAQFHWHHRAGVGRDKWGISFAVLRDGVPLGIQDMDASGFADRRTVDTGSWITRSAQGGGLGTEMRHAVLGFAFDHLGAEWAESSAAEWNEPSLGVSRKVGYERNGASRVSPRPGESFDEVRLRLPRARYRRPDWELRVEGADAAKRQLGIE